MRHLTALEICDFLEGRNPTEQTRLHLYGCNDRITWLANVTKLNRPIAEDERVWLAKLDNVREFLTS